MRKFEINLKEESLETLYSLMNHSNYFLLELNERLQYYNRGMQIYVEKVLTKDKHLNILENSLSEQNLESLNYIKTITEDNLNLSTVTISSLSDLLTEQANFLQSVMDEIKLRT